MAYELYQSKFKGSEIDSLLSDVVNIKDQCPTRTEVAAQIEASLTDIPSREEVSDDISEAVKDFPTKAEVTEEIEESTKYFQTATEVEQIVSDALTDIPDKTEVEKMIDDHVVEVPIATTEVAGIVKPDDITIKISDDGTIRGIDSLDNIPNVILTDPTKNDILIRTSDGKWVNKKYFQVSSMPNIADVENGETIQYLGATNENYIKGHFYGATNINTVIQLKKGQQWINNTYSTFTFTFAAWTSAITTVYDVEGNEVIKYIKGQTGPVTLKPGYKIVVTSDYDGGSIQFNLVKQEWIDIYPAYTPIIATTEKTGVVKPDGTTITVDADGTIHGASSIEALGDIGDVEITSPKNDEGLVYKDGKWVNSVINAGETVLGYEDYSTEEKVIGVWTDGRPVYRKCYVFTTSNTQIPAYQWFDLEFSCESNNWFLSVDVRASESKGATFPLAAYNNPLTGKICVMSYRNSGQGAAAGSILITTYIKTTDAANSFKPQLIASKFGVAGIGYENYSSDEVCIGKWIDGRPLYRKIIVNTTPKSTNTLYQIPTNVSDILDVVDIRGMWKFDTTSWIPMILTVGSNAQLYIYYDIQAKSLVLSTTVSEWTNRPLNIILLYTRSKDAANSFTPDMVYSGMIDSQTATDAEVTEVLS